MKDTQVNKWIYENPVDVGFIVYGCTLMLIAVAVLGFNLLT